MTFTKWLLKNHTKDWVNLAYKNVELFICLDDHIEQWQDEERFGNKWKRQAWILPGPTTGGHIKSNVAHPKETMPASALYDHVDTVIAEIHNLIDNEWVTMEGDMDFDRMNSKEYREGFEQALEDARRANENNFDKLRHIITSIDRGRNKETICTIRPLTPQEELVESSNKW